MNARCRYTTPLPTLRMPRVAAKTYVPTRHLTTDSLRSASASPILLHLCIIVIGLTPRASRMIQDSRFIRLFCCLNNLTFTFFILLLRQTHKVEVDL